MTISPSDYQGVYNQNTNMLGIVLEIYPADDPRNRFSAGFDDYRGPFHTCRVLIIDDGSNAQTTLEQVIITPDCTSGIDDYYEKLPKPSTKLVDGGTMAVQGNNYDPNLLDGDRCVIAFIGGSIDKPFIVRWWPHAKNFYDPATSGTGDPDPSGRGSTLQQTPRFFKRVNGTETVVNGSGDVIVSTTLANSVVAPQEGSSEGRYARTERTEGGSVKLFVKDSQTLEFDFNPQADGIGVLGRADVQMPQTNPRPNPPQSGQSRSNTYVKLDKTNVEYYVPTKFKVHSRGTVNVSATGNINIDTDANASISSQVDINLDSAQVLKTKSILETEISSAYYIKLNAIQVLLGPALVYPATPATSNPVYLSTLIDGAVAVLQGAINGVWDAPGVTTEMKVEALKAAIDGLFQTLTTAKSTTVFVSI